MVPSRSRAVQVHSWLPCPPCPTGRWRALSYRGDPLLRPIASNELPLLVRPLVRASRAANAALGLDVPYCEGEEEANPPEHLGHVALLWARKRGYRWARVRRRGVWGARGAVCDARGGPWADWEVAGKWPLGA